MKITDVKNADVMSAIQDGKKLICADLKEEAVYDCSTMTIEALQETIKSDAVRFFAVEK